MKKEMRRNKLFFLKYLLLFMPLLFLTYCQQSNEDVVDFTEDILTVDSSLSVLIKSAIEEEEGEQCVNFKYPIEFYTYFPERQSMQFLSISNDDELYEFFDTLRSDEQISIDFPVYIVDTDGEETAIYSLEEMEEILQIVVDACRGTDGEYDYCDDSNKKVYVCHEGNTLCISINALKAHLDHGDILGKCEDDEDDEDDQGDIEYEYCDENNKKVYICHNGNTLCVSLDALQAHLDHGDTLGQCE